ncbi:MAG: thioredoxin domain-containing protein, partial [Chlamydiia bacterium]|nr:thioredoxin domain-containing protein [Chlamydiia bacterium]
DWWPWGEDAFHTARVLDRPIFLSIGYATCHWCHVMEKESFENREIASLMNDTFICVKVDREELPEIDNLYMEFAQAMMAGAAGWPLNLVLDTELKPFYAATYIPPHSSDVQIGMDELTEKMAEVWNSDDREKLLAQGDQVIEAFKAHAEQGGSFLPSKLTVDNAAGMLLGLADPVWGGVKGAPKFPIPYQTAFMLRYSVLSGDSRALFYVDKTLDMMQRGGIYDHIGGGFSRYSVDERWLVPHFEKMLYDNAQLADLYCEAWRATQNPLYKDVSCEVLNYLLRDMSSPTGGFYAAQDADSEGTEGLFYTWSREEIEALLGKDADVFCEFYGVIPAGNFEGRNILSIEEREEDFARSRGWKAEELAQTLAACRARLHVEREKRSHPLKDDKVLSSWNGLAIHAFAHAGFAFDRPDYTAAAVKAARFIRDTLWVDGRLMRRWCEGDVRFLAGLDEYAFLIRGLLTLYVTGAGTEWLEWAMEMTNILTEDHLAPQGAFYMSDGRDPNLVLRRCYYADGAEPSGNGVHGENLVRLYQITGNSSYQLMAQGIFKAVSRFLDSYPPGYGFHLLALQRLYDPSKSSIVIALNANRDKEAELRTLLGQANMGHSVVLWRACDDDAFARLVPERTAQTAQGGQTTVYICRDGTFGPALMDWAEIQAALAKV